VRFSNKNRLELFQIASGDQRHDFTFINKAEFVATTNLIKIRRDAMIEMPRCLSLASIPRIRYEKQGATP
jgi:hypothetical protein